MLGMYFYPKLTITVLSTSLGLVRRVESIELRMSVLRWLFLHRQYYELSQKRTGEPTQPHPLQPKTDSGAITSNRKSPSRNRPRPTDNFSAKILAESGGRLAYRGGGASTLSCLP